LIEEGFDLADAKLLDDTIFELIERGTRDLRRTREHPVNGWTFWECRPPGQGKWLRLKALRRSE